MKKCNNTWFDCWPGGAVLPTSTWSGFGPIRSSAWSPSATYRTGQSHQNLSLDRKRMVFSSLPHQAHLYGCRGPPAFWPSHISERNDQRGYEDPVSLTQLITTGEGGLTLQSGMIDEDRVNYKLHSEDRQSVSYSLHGRRQVLPEYEGGSRRFQ